MRILALALALACGLRAQSIDVAQKLQGFDDYMAKTLKDWNGPGIGVGIVVGDKLVFAKGYGYRDVEKKLPVTPGTVFQIASNSKLFTAVSAGMLVEEGKLTWDKPVREAVPSIRFYNDQLNNNVTLRDMLSHRTGITRHDNIWYKSGFSRKELFDRVQYLEPQAPMRQTFLYNNLMYAATGQIIELQSGKTWEQFVTDRILKPLEMSSTGFTIDFLRAQPEHGVGFTEKREGFDLYRLPYYEDQAGIGPAGAIVSNINDMSHWLIALMNHGRYNGQQVLPQDVLKETLQPAIGLPNTAGEQLGYWELVNPAYGMGRNTGVYRGHLMTFHGGDLPGFHSQVSFLPNDRIGVIVFVIGNHIQPLYNLLTYNIYERLLGMDQTPWTERGLKTRLKSKDAASKARQKAGEERVAGTRPSHALADYAGDYESPAYGILKITSNGDALQFDFHKVRMPLQHFHYDRFDTADDEDARKHSVNFRTNPQGDIDQAMMSLDEAEVAFVRKPETLDPAVLSALAGSYETTNGSKLLVKYQETAGLSLLSPGASPVPLTRVKGTRFRSPQFSDVTFEFVLEGGQVKAMKQKSPAGEYVFPRLR